MNTQWRKSSYSANGSNCVEVRLADGVVQTRDTKDPDGGVLGFDRAAWNSFLTAVRGGQVRR